MPLVKCQDLGGVPEFLIEGKVQDVGGRDLLQQPLYRLVEERALPNPPGSDQEEDLPFLQGPCQPLERVPFEGRGQSFPNLSREPPLVEPF